MAHDCSDDPRQQAKVAGSERLGLGCADVLRRPIETSMQTRCHHANEVQYVIPWTSIRGVAVYVMDGAKNRTFDQKPQLVIGKQGVGARALPTGTCGTSARRACAITS